MQVSVGTTSHRSILQATKQIIKEVVYDINGTPDFIIVGFTPNYKYKQEYEDALQMIYEESGTQNIIGGAFPGVGTSNEVPTTQGCAMQAVKSNEMHFHTPQAHSGIRLKQKGAANELGKAFRDDENTSKMGIVLTTGPTLLPDAIEDMKVLDLYFARKFKGMFNFIGDIINKSMAKQGFGVNGYFADLLKALKTEGVTNLVGGATIDLSLEPNYQFSRDEVIRGGLVGTIMSSNKLKFGHSWMFDKAKKSKEYVVSDFLRSGYFQRISCKPANKKILDTIGMSQELYSEFFETMSYANLLYLSAFKDDDGESIPYVTMSHPKLKGVVASISKNGVMRKGELNAEMFTQSGEGIQRSAKACATRAIEGISKPKFGIFMNCSNRLLIARDKIVNEAVTIGEVLGDDVPFISLYTGGELSILDGKPIDTAAAVHGVVAGE